VKHFDFCSVLSPETDIQSHFCAESYFFSQWKVDCRRMFSTFKYSVHYQKYVCTYCENLDSELWLLCIVKWIH